MKKLVQKESFGKIILVSGDGDYKKLVDFLVKKDKFEKILFPNSEFASSLYKKLGSEFYDDLDNAFLSFQTLLEKYDIYYLYVKVNKIYFTI